MAYISQYDETGAGALFLNGTIGLISRTPLQDEELPPHSFAYVLYRPNNRKHTWILERLTQDTDIPHKPNEYELHRDEIPSFAYVYFVVEPNIEYVCFDDEDNEDIYIEWDAGYSLNDILLHSPEAEE